MEATPFLPYGRQQISEDDIRAVSDVLRSDWLTQGPAVPAFEDALADRLDTDEVVACSSGTAALHLAMLSLGLGPGDAIVTSPITFVASANCARYVGAEVIFADVDPATGLIDPESVAAVLDGDRERRIKAIIPVHLAGQPADLAALADLARPRNVWIVEDACHALGAEYADGKMIHKIGGNPHSDLSVFSFHPVKHIATGEGGAVSTAHPELAERMRRFRNHGLSRESTLNEDMALSPEGQRNPWYYEMDEPGYNYRLTDIQAALGLQQLKQLSWSLERRREIAAQYRSLIKEMFPDGAVTPLTIGPGVSHAYHLFIVRIDFDRLGVSRATVMNRLRSRGIGAQVHYIPVHLQPYYRRLCGTAPGSFPQAERYYQQALSLPMYPGLTVSDVTRVMEELAGALERKTQSVSVR